MKKTILFISLGLTTMLSANSFDTQSIKTQHPQVKKHLQKKMAQKHLKAAQKQHMEKMDRQFAHKKAMKRTFRTAEEFRRIKGHSGKNISYAPHKKIMHRFHETKHEKNVRTLKRASRYSNYRNDYNTYDYDEGYERNDYRDHRRYQIHQARGYRHTRNSWYLAYRYERASFYDRHGYHYGYFNYRGYMFEGEFYRYDRYYTFRDRLRGKGLFEHRFYRPILNYYYANNDYYGNIGGFEFFFRR